MDEPVIVVGAGIGGLSAALCLAHESIPVVVVERFAEVREVGAGILLGPNASRVLYARGLGDALERVSAPMTHLGIGADRGELFVEKEANARADAPFRMIHRAALHGVLYEAATQHALIEVETGRAVEGFEHDAERGRVRAVGDEGWAGGWGRALIGCDGLRSAVRAQLHPGEAQPAYHGYTCWRGVTSRFEHEGFARGMLLELQGRGRRAGMGYIDEERVYWWATANTPQGERDGEDVIEDLQRRFEAFPDYFRAMIASTPAAQVLRNDIFDRPPLKMWGQENVTLLGDAAHPMAPNLGQGACSAIEDAAMLARCFAELRDEQGSLASVNVASAFRRYEARRCKRTAMLQRLSRQFGTVGQLEHPVAVWMRELAMRWTPRAMLDRQQAEIWDYRVEGGA
ncbi:FAD-binding protein [Lujinxingia vulgaris]|uniref:FAD-binding protein n=1 Tax=Lujinxingia vulgaris TaxID=2600176 RepID=A0A5C6X5E9_9DELT|nr:FAD-dependent monooxygenase [Lujinxingia vulgaris]TXD37129.1 FAD-binding protein [Lujinxingia vulgaris]